jgi:GTPase SAR1 family protein
MSPSRALEQHIAVFGESGSGKTVLVSSFYGSAQEPEYQKRSPFYVVADDTGQGRRLHQNYLGMRDSAQLPGPTRFAATSYSFSIKLKDASVAKAMKSSSFDALRLVWHDYPGEWFEEDQSSDEEKHRRADAFRALLQSDVALFLVDGQKLLDHAGEEERYLKSLFTNFRNGLLSIWDDLDGDGAPVVEFPRIWVLALSKSDLLSGMNAFAFRDLLIAKVSGEIDELQSVIASLVQASDALSVGDDFLLLSSAKFEPGQIDVSSQVGLDLILPVAAALPLGRHLKWAKARQGRGQVAEHLMAGVESLAGALGGIGALATALGGQKNKIVASIGLLLTHFGTSLTSLARVGSNQVKQANIVAAAKQKSLLSTFSDFERDLEKGTEEHVLIRGDK